MSALLLRLTYDSKGSDDPHTAGSDPCSCTPEICSARMSDMEAIASARGPSSKRPCLLWVSVVLLLLVGLVVVLLVVVVLLLVVVALLVVGLLLLVVEEEVVGCGGLCVSRRRPPHLGALLGAAGVCVGRVEVRA